MPKSKASLGKPPNSAREIEQPQFLNTKNEINKSPPPISDSSDDEQNINEEIVASTKTRHSRNQPIKHQFNTMSFKNMQITTDNDPK